LPADVSVIVNVQGDEPLLDPATVDAVAAALLDDPAVVMASLMCPLPPGRENDPNVVKVVCDHADFALYFSRSPLPFRRSTDAPYAPQQHVGLYAYRRDFLETLTRLAPPRSNKRNPSNNCACSNTAIGQSKDGGVRAAHPKSGTRAETLGTRAGALLAPTQTL
jgi:CMP-2-keto-3-deoxyoctulosonic acid synthetase